MGPLEVTLKPSFATELSSLVVKYTITGLVRGNKVLVSDINHLWEQIYT